jgi:hypothetical protein
MELIRRSGYEAEKRTPIVMAFMTEVAFDFKTVRDIDFMNTVAQVKVRPCEHLASLLDHEI